MKYTIDYTQDERGRWSAHVRKPDGDGEASVHMPSRLSIEDCVGDVYDIVGDDAELEVGDVREYPGLGLFAAVPA